MKVRVRFGIKTGSWIFPNAAIFVFKMEPSRFATLEAAVSQIKMVLPGDWGGKLICEGEAI